VLVLKQNITKIMWKIKKTKNKMAFLEKYIIRQFSISLGIINLKVVIPKLS